MDSAKLQTLEGQLYSKMPLVGAGQRRKAAETLAQDGSPEAVRLLAEAITRSDDEQVYKIAIAALRQLAKQGSLEAQQELCRLVIEYNHPTAREIVLSEQYAPQGPNQQALFYFLTEQWEKYEQLDFDRSWLKVIYETANEKMRRQLAHTAKKAGRVEWVQIVAGVRKRQQLGVMTDAEWEASLTILARDKQWDEIWRLAQIAPIEWSVKLLQHLDEVKWKPQAAEEQATFMKLVGLAKKCAGEIAELADFLPCYATLQQEDITAVFCLAISQDSQLLASATRSPDNQFPIKLWSLKDKRLLKTLHGHDSMVVSLVISPDGRTLVGCDRIANKARIWSLPDGELIKDLEGEILTGAFAGLLISSDSQVLIGCLNEKMGLWSLPDGDLIKTLEGHKNSIFSSAISPDGKILATASLDKTIRLWSFPDGNLLNVQPVPNRVLSLVFSPDGKLLIGGGLDKTVRFWGVPDLQQLKILEGHTGAVQLLAITPDERILVSGSDDKTVRLWSLPDGQALNTLTGHPGGIRCIAISPDRLILASGSSTVFSKAPEIFLWSLPDGKLLKTLTGLLGWAGTKGLAISQDGKWLASGHEGVHLWKLDLVRLSRLPIDQTSVEDILLVQRMLQDSETSEAAQNWLKLLQNLMVGQRRFDIELEDVQTQIEPGEFDIDIDH